jgi:hypothetical protein
MHAVDRAVAAIGGRQLISGRPGIGWLVVEMTPAMIWTQVTGALSLEFFYFVAYLTLLGADESSLAWLSMVVFCGGIGQALVVLRRQPTDPKRRCVVDTLVGRLWWLGTILWPLACWALGLGRGIMLGGVFACVMLAQLTHLCGVSGFVVWTQALVPTELRGVFYAWRHITSYFAVAVVLFVVSAVFPKSNAHDPAQLPWLGALLGGATILGIIGCIPLARAPGTPPSTHLAVYAPLWPKVRGHAPFLRLAAWWMLVNAGMAASMAYQPLIYLAAGADSQLMAHWQSLATYPAMLLGIFVAGWSLPRMGGRASLIIANCAVLASEIALLALTPATIGWLLPPLLALSGFAKGFWSVSWISRLQEVAPRGDPRFTSLFVAAASGAGLAMAIALHWLVPAIESWRAELGWSVSAAWVMVAVGAAFRFAATPLLLWPDRHREEPELRRPRPQPLPEAA